MEPALKANGAWQRLRAFQSSEKKEGLKWLLSRRNLIIHSLHLHPIESAEGAVFNSQFNHLETVHRDKLRPQTPRGEAELMFVQLTQAAGLFRDFLSVVQLSPKRATRRYG